MKNNSLEEIKKLVYHGHFIESKSLLSNLINDFLPLEEKIEFKLLWYKTHIGLHDYETVLKEIDSTIDLIKQSNMESELLQVLYMKSYALSFRNKTDESLLLAKEGLKLIRDMSKKRQQQVLIEKAYLNLQIGHNYFSMKDYKKALLHAKRSLKIFEELNSHVGIGSSFELFGLINYGLVNFPVAIDFFKEGLEIFIDLEINHLILNSYYYLGSVYYHKGELHQALDYMNKLAPYIEKYNDDYRVAVYLLNLVPLISENGDYDLAQKKILQCIAIAKKIKRYNILGRGYYRLIQITLSQNKIPKAKKYLQLLYALGEGLTDNKYLSDYIRLAEAQISIRSKDLAEIKKAKTILSDLIENYNANIENAYEARYYLCRILLREYLETSSEEILEQLDVLIKEILGFGNKGELIGFRIKANNIQLLVLLIQEQCSTIETKIHNVEQLLMNVQRITERIGLRSIAKEFSEEQMKLLQQKHSLEDFKKTYYSFDE